MALKRILRIDEVLHVTGLKRTTLYRKLKAKQFPAPVRLATQTVGWREQDVEAWIESLKPVSAEAA